VGGERSSREEATGRFLHGAGTLREMPAERLFTRLGAALPLLLAACPSSTSDSRPAANAAAPPEAPAEPAEPAEPAAQPEAPSEGAEGRIGEGPLPLAEMLGSSPPEVQALLGEPFGKGMMRETCVRFLPQRTWFRCKYVWQRYQDVTGNFEAVQIAYENGKASAIALEGIRGDGPFDPRRALRIVGVELPGDPDESSPAADTKLWSWFNAAARLRVHGRQYRVEVSSVRDEWETSKVELILNDPLSPEEQDNIVEP
jgi:hypothetical protein